MRSHSPMVVLVCGLIRPLPGCVVVLGLALAGPGCGGGGTGSGNPGAPGGTPGGGGSGSAVTCMVTLRGDASSGIATHAMPCASMPGAATNQVWQFVPSTGPAPGVPPVASVPFYASLNPAPSGKAETVFGSLSHFSNGAFPVGSTLTSQAIFGSMALSEQVGWAVVTTRTDHPDMGVLQITSSTPATAAECGVSFGGQVQPSGAPCFLIHGTYHVVLAPDALGLTGFPAGAGNVTLDFAF